MRLFFLVFLFISTTVLTAQDQNYQAFVLDKSLTGKADAILRSDEFVIDLTAQNSMTQRRKKVITVLNKMGDRYAFCAVGYDNSRKIKDVEAVVYDASGKQITKIKESKFKDVSAVDGSTLYSDSRYKYYSYTPAQYPYTVVLTYETETKNTGELRSQWTFLNDFKISTEKSSITINFNTPDLKPAIKEMNFEGLNIEKKESSGSISYEAKQIPAIRDESMSPSFIDIAPHIKIRPVIFQYEGFDANISDWNDLGRWMHSNLLAGRDELPEAVKDRARAMVQGVDDDLEKAKIIYKYVQDNTRYISVQVGIGGMQPISAIEVDRVKYGDCKGLSNYTKALLKAVGVEAYYTHVEAGPVKVDFDEEFPDLAQGNHVILAIPYNNKYYWIDCTSQIHPFGFIGDFTDGRKVFIIKPDGGEIVETTSYVNEQNYQSTFGQYAMHEDGSISGTIAIRTKGIQYDDRFGLEHQPKDKIAKHYKDYWDNINNLNVKAYQFTNDRDTIVFKESVSVSAVNYASKSGNRMLFTANAFNNNKYIPKRYRNRKLPFQVQRGFLDEDVIVIKLPDGYKVEALPENIQIENDFGLYSCTYEKALGEIIYKRKFLVKSGKYPNSEYEAYRQFMKDVAKWDSTKTVIIKS